MTSSFAVAAPREGPDGKLEQTDESNALLDLACTSLTKWEPDFEKPTPMITPWMIATSVVYSRGNVADRAMAERFLTLTMPARSGESDASRHLSEQQAKFWLKASLAPNDALQNEVAKFEQVLRDAAPAGEPFPHPTDNRLATAYGLAWNEAKMLEFGQRCYGGVFSQLAERNVAYRAAAFKALVERDLADQAPVDAVVNIVQYANVESDNGFPSLGVGKLEEIHRLDFRFSALCDHAIRLQDLGRIDDRDAALLAASGVRFEDGFGVPGDFDYGRFIDLGMEDFAKRLYETASIHARGDWTSDNTPAEFFARLGIAAAIFEDKPTIAFVNKQLQACIDAEEEFEKKADLTFYLAAIARQQGDEKAAMEIANRGEKLAPKMDFYGSSGFKEVIRATFRKVSIREGLRLAASVCEMPIFLDFDRRHAVGLYVREGKFRNAWEVSEEMQPGLQRIKARVHVLVNLERAKQHDLAMEFLNAVEDPIETATLALYTARDILGTRGFGTGNVTIWD